MTPEKLVRYCPSHADRFARAIVPILLNLPPLAEEPDDRGQESDGSGSGSGSYSGDDDDGDVNGDNRTLSMAQASLGAAAAAVVTAERHAAATESLLALRRPLEAFLRTRMLLSVPGSSRGFSSSGSSALSPAAGRKRRCFGGEKTGKNGDGYGGGGGGGDGLGQEDDDHGRGESCSRRRFAGRDGEGRRAEAGAVVSPAPTTRGNGIKTNNGAATPTPMSAAAYLELEDVLLPRCIVPLFEAAAGAKKTKGAAEEQQLERGRRKGEGVGGGSPQQEMKEGMLKCLQAVLEVSRRSRGRGGRGSATDAALDALRK